MSSLYELIEKHNHKNTFLESLRPKIRRITLGTISRGTNLEESIQTNLSMTLQALEQHGEFIDFQMTIIKKNVNDFVLEHRHLMFPNIGKLTKISKVNIRNVAILLSLLRTIKDRFHLEHTSTVRDVFYSNVELYQKQTRVNYWLQLIASNFKLSSINKLNIVPAQKGLIFSSIHLSIDDSIILKPGIINLVPYINNNSRITMYDKTYKFERKVQVKIYEKEAIFNKIVQNYSNNTQNFQSLLSENIFITGKGYPDNITKLLIERLSNCLVENILIKLYVDADPYGINIALSYMKNVQNISLIHYSGVSITHLIKFGGQVLSMNYREYTIAKTTIRRITKQMESTKAPILNTPFPSLRLELQRQMFLGKKGEMNALYT